MKTSATLICTRPFEWCEVHPDGSVFLCCPAWLKRSVGNLLQQSVEEIWNGPVAQEIRKSVLNGSFHNCSSKRCPYLLDQRPPVSQLEAISEQQLRQALTSNNARLEYLPRQLNLCFDHSCNLACPSCRGAVLQAEGCALQPVEQLGEIILKELIPSARSITISGYGDPFGSPTYLRLLRRLDQGSYPQLQQIRLHTNGQLLTPQMWRSLPNLQTLISEIEISVDAATGKTYRQNRPGGDFDLLLNNLQFLSTQPAELTLSMVLQQNNWRELDQLLELAGRFKARVYLSQLVNWGTYRREEFKRRAVHLVEHPEHLDFVAKLKEISARDGVKLGNLQVLQRG